MGSNQSAEEQQAHFWLVRQTRQKHRLPNALRIALHAGTPLPLSSPPEREPHSSRSQALQHPPRRQLQRENRRFRPGPADQLPHAHPPAAQLDGLGGPRADAGAPIDAACRHALVPRSRAHHAAKPLQRVHRHVVRRLHHGGLSPRDSCRRSCCRRWRRTR